MMGHANTQDHNAHVEMNVSSSGESLSAQMLHYDARMTLSQYLLPC